jgi:hypothetical protein
MSDQLSLIDSRPVTWRLDQPTREAGRRGIEVARQALEDAYKRRSDRLESARQVA